MERGCQLNDSLADGYLSKNSTEPGGQHTGMAPT